jgi:2-polyprenyl-3-methyl-5-hydroxy-6-metoxy-1,4-benzoquinol methylase
MSTKTPQTQSDMNRWIKCPICSSVQQRVLFRASDINWKTTTETFDVVQCGSCGVAYTYPQPSIDQLKKYYPEVYYSIEDLSEEYYANKWRPLQIEKLKIVQQFRKAGKLLDVGCGRGYFLYEARSAGFDVEGIDFSEDTANLAKSRWNLDIKAADVVTYPYPKSKYDVVTLYHSLEHIAQPTTLLEGLRNTLKDNGILVIAVPNFGSIQSRFFRDKWLHLDVPRHLFQYSPKSLSTLVQNNGFTVEGIFLKSREYDAAGIFGSFWRRSPENNSLVESLVRKTLGSTMRIFSKIENSLGSGATVTLVASKK